MKKLIISLLSLLSVTSLSAQDNNPIKVNQVGYYPSQEKVATIEKSAVASKYTITDADGNIVWKDKAKRKAVSPWSQKERDIIDFSTITQPGEYTIKAGKRTQKFIVKDNALSELATSSMKAFYLQRTGVPILEEYVGEYARPAAHLDTCVFVHPAACSEARPAGFKISSPYGWYDAGDFNKYIVNSGFTIGLMLSALEMNEEYFSAMKLNIPESGNSTPDFLDEIYFNLRWMITMQDVDGGVYHKLTTPSFEAFIMPIECRQQRYVTQKSTSATLDYAATMAKASRIYGKYPEYKEFASMALSTAKKAYEWAEKNPDVYYDQSGNNKKFKPAITTGEYGDRQFRDEFFWASSELFLTTQDMSFIKDVEKYMPQSFTLPTWGNVYGLGVYAWIAQIIKENKGQMQIVSDIVRPAITVFCDNILATVPSSCYNSPYGNVEQNFHWGCLAESCCGQGIALLYAYRLTGNKKYLVGALENMDYILGRNATGFCYVTGFGQTPTMHPHQRLSATDGIDAPLPGFLAGGPNPGQQDKNDGVPPYPSNYPDECYLDHQASYASNEIAINWNAALVSLAGWLEAEMN